MTQAVLLYGSRDFAKTVAELAGHCGYRVAGTIDDYATGPGILGNLQTVFTSHPPARYQIAFAIGYKDLPARFHAWERVRQLGYSTVTLVHPRAYVADSASLGEGTIVMAGAIVDVRARIGSIAVLWPGANVSHDSAVGVNSFLSPGAILCGHVVIGHSTFIGAGAVVADHQDVPAGAHLKANTVFYRKPPSTA